MLRWSINLFRVFGIQLSLHASFLLLLAYAAYAGADDGGGWAGAGWSLGLVMIFFVCVVLHELGHSLTARYFGIQVPRILLLPIGGMAEFERIPRQPSQELLITIAGPAVNFAIAGMLFVIARTPANWPLTVDYPDSLVGLVQMLMTWNLAMGFFNLLPVFPMDGGRILRALLATRLAYLRATYWAAAIGRILALTFAAIAAFYFHRPQTCILFLFIAWAGTAEYNQTLRIEQQAPLTTDLDAIKRVDANDSATTVPPALPSGQDW